MQRAHVKFIIVTVIMFEVACADHNVHQVLLTDAVAVQNVAQDLLTGVVLDEFEHPAAGIQVYSAQDPNIVSTTDANGEFALNLLHTPQPQTGLRKIFARGNGSRSRAFIQQQVRYVVLRMNRLQRVDTTVLDEYGRPVSGARVRDALDSESSAVTDAYGNVTFLIFPFDRQLHARVEASGFSRWDAFVNFSLSPPYQFHVRLKRENRSSKSVSDGRSLDADQASGVVQNAYHIRGLIKDTRGHPVGNARVSAIAEDAGSAADSNSLFKDYVSFAADPNGMFELTVHNLGAYEMNAWWPGSYETSSQTSVKSGDSNVLIILQHGGVIQMRLQFEDGALVPSRDILQALSNKAGSEPLAFEDAGRDGVKIAFPKSGEQNATIFGSSFLPLDFGGNVPEGGTLDIGTIKVSRGLSVEGTVRTSGGIPVPYAKVDVRPDLSESKSAFAPLASHVLLRTTKADGAGRYRFAAIEPKVFLSASDFSGNLSERRPIGNGGRIDLILRPASKISGCKPCRLDPCNSCSHDCFAIGPRLQRGGRAERR